MALDFFTGFDHYATADLTLGVTSRFTSIQNATVASGSARNGSNGLSLSIGATAWVKKTGLSNAATRVLGFAFKATDILSDAFRAIASLADGDPETAAQVSLVVTDTGAISVYRATPGAGGRNLGSNSGGTLLGTSTNTLSSNTWYYIELVVTVNNTTGTVEVYVNGTKTGWIDLTSQDTQASSSAQANAFGFNGRNSGGVSIDDVYCLSGSGGVRTSRLGDVKCVAVVASAGDGAVGQFTPSSGTDNGAMVDDAAPNSDTDYNASSSVGNIDTYAFASLGSVGTIYGLNLHNFVKKTDAGTCDAQGVVRISSTNHLQTQRAIGTSYGYSTDLLEQSPATVANFTAAEVDGAEFGVKHAA